MSAVLDPETYYDEDGEPAWNRLDESLHGRLEWAGTIDILQEYLVQNGHIIDAGGGAGRYTVWLAERDYEGTLVDPGEGQRTITHQQATHRGLEERVTIIARDSRELSAQMLAACRRVYGQWDYDTGSAHRYPHHITTS